MTSAIKIQRSRQAPPTRPMLGTLLDAVTVEDNSRLLWAEGSALYVSWNETDGTQIVDDLCAAGVSLTAAGPKQVSGVRFGVREMFGCQSVGLDIEGLKAVMSDQC